MFTPANHMPKPLETGNLAPWPAVGTGNISHLAKSSPPLRVLVVDDEPLIRWSLVETLEQAGYGVSEAENGAGAIRSVAAGGPYDVVLLDYRLPDSNDLTLLSTIRRLAPSAAVIMMTAFGTPEVTDGALALGAYCVMGKPFEVHDLADLVQRAHTRCG
jgi:DNA-binding NtrC family response regulator